MMTKIVPDQDRVNKSADPMLVEAMDWEELGRRDHRAPASVDIERVRAIIAAYQSLPILDPRPIKEIVEELNG